MLRLQSLDCSSCLVQKEFKGPDDVPSEDVEAVAAELKASEVVDVSEDGFQIRRKDVRSLPFVPSSRHIVPSAQCRRLRSWRRCLHVRRALGRPAVEVSAGVQMPTDWDPIKAAVAKRSVHAAPFRCSETIESVGMLFSEHGTVNQVRLQRVPGANGKGTHFAGSAIVEMATQEAADALLAATVERHGATLRLQSKGAYLQALKDVRNGPEAAAL